MNSDASGRLILFDGVCNLCERTVQFVIRNDARARFRFASLQSPAAQRVLADVDRRTDDELSSVLLVDGGRVYRKSEAALRIAKRLDGAWPLFYYLFFWVPRSIADLVYDFVGNRRYRWFGKKDACWMPNEDLRRRFLDDPASGDRGSGI